METLTDAVPHHVFDGGNGPAQRVAPQLDHAASLPQAWPRAQPPATPAVRADGWETHDIWEHSATLRDLYAKRCRQEVPLMTCHVQAARLLAPHVSPGDTLLDAGCASGYFVHAVADLPVRYWGIDSALSLLRIGRDILGNQGVLHGPRLQHIRIEDLSAQVDHVVCVNVLTYLDNYHRPLERLLQSARKTVILRESIAEHGRYHYPVDPFLESPEPLRVHINTYARDELVKFIEGYGFTVTLHQDAHTGGVPQEYLGCQHHWTFVEAVRS